MDVTTMTLGSDVEYFVARTVDNAIVSAEGHIPGSKKDPAPFGTQKGFATQLDNVLAEGNIPPGTNSTVVADSIAALRAHLDDLLRPKGLKTVARAAAEIPEEFLKTENALTFGCDASYNCWTLKEEPVTPTGNLRTAGFHIHIGYEDPDEDTNIAIARLLDVTLGLAAASEEPTSERHKLGYGLAGNFRHQPHGVEYRTLSSHWLSRPNYVRWAFDTAYYTVHTTFYSPELLVHRMKGLRPFADIIQEMINTDNVAGARALRHKLDLALPGINRYTPSYYG